jgi:hypothetical protein
MTWLRRLLLSMAGLSLILAAACGAPVSAPVDAEIAAMTDISIAWDASWEGEEANWALLRADFVVSSSETGEPYNNVIIEIISGYSGVYLLPTGVINVENCPEGEAQWGQYCSDPDQTWGELTGNFNSNLQPTFYRGYTNGRGVETIWLWVEDLPVVDDAAIGVEIWATIGVDSLSFQVLPTG